MTVAELIDYIATIYIKSFQEDVLFRNGEISPMVDKCKIFVAQLKLS